MARQYSLSKRMRKKRSSFDLLEQYILSYPLLDWLPICQPVNRSHRFYIPIGNVILYLSGHRLPDGSLLGERKGRTTSDRFTSLHASVYEVPVRSNRAICRSASTSPQTLSGILSHDELRPEVDYGGLGEKTAPCRPYSTLY